MSEISKTVRLTLIGWATVLAFAAAVLISRGSDELGPAIVYGALAVGMGFWVWKRQSRAALVTSIAIGALHLLQQVGYSLAGAADDPFEAATFVIDVLAVPGAALIVAGAAGTLIQRRRTVATTS